MSINDVNVMIQVWLENYHTFNVIKLLSFVDQRLKIVPDATFFSLCSWQFARQGDSQSLEYVFFIYFFHIIF